jgi:hypothetical protein
MIFAHFSLPKLLKVFCFLLIFARHSNVLRGVDLLYATKVVVLCDLQFETFALQLKWTVQNDGFEVYCYVDYISQKIPEPWQFNYIALAHEFRLCKYAFDLQHFSFDLQLSSSSLFVTILGLRGIGIDFQFNPFALQLD